MTTSNPPNRDTQSREIAGLFLLCQSLKIALKQSCPSHRLLKKAERYAVYREGYSGKPCIDYAIVMKFEGDLRDDFFKANI